MYDKTADYKISSTFPTNLLGLRHYLPKWLFRQPALDQGLHRSIAAHLLWTRPGSVAHRMTGSLVWGRWTPAGSRQGRRCPGSSPVEAQARPCTTRQWRRSRCAGWVSWLHHHALKPEQPAHVGAAVRSTLSGFRPRKPWQGGCRSQHHQKTDSCFHDGARGIGNLARMMLAAPFAPSFTPFK